MTLRADGPEYVPLRTFRDDDLLDPGSDPLIALMGALSALYEGERVVARLLLRSLGPDWSQAHMEKAHKRPGMEPREPAYTFQTKPLQMDGITMAVLGIGALAALKGYLWVQDGEIWKAALLGTGTALGLAAGGWAWWRWKRARSRVEDPILIQEKVSRIAFDAELHVTAIVPSRTGPQRAGELLGPVAAAYRHYDNPAGARFGINLLDTRIFADRDRTADSVVRVAKGLWEQWGPRMQSILEQTVKTLHEANEQMEAEAQFTILDGLKLLSNEPFRKDVLKKVSDPYLLEWWGSTFTGWSRDYKADSLAPVQTRLSYYASSKRARAILGQRRSTIDLRRTVHDGGVLLVSTSQGTVGRDVAALVGASLLNLVDAVIREQGSLPLSRRRGALVVVDEMQSMPGVDYESMLSELGKFGASFILATQSLAKLDDLSRTMRDTVLANVGCLAVFQVAGNDARTLVWELGKERVTEDDITSLPVHHCYVRATVGTERMPAFSMMVRKPEDGDPAVADRIREATSAYTVSDREGEYADADGHKKVGDYRKGIEDLEGGGTGEPQAEEDADRRTQKSKRDRGASDAASEAGYADEDRAAEDEGEEAEL